MKTLCWILGLLSVLLPGCSDDAIDGTSPVSGRFSIRLAAPVNTSVDTAQVFFFRKRPTTDTLIYRQVIYGLFPQLDSFQFKVPAGYYRVVVLGNVDPNKIGSFGEFTSSDMLVEYAMSEPPVLYYGSQNVNVGQERTTEIGLTLATSQVVLTLKEIPYDAFRIDMTLLNTGSGVFLDRTYIDEVVDPPLFKRLDGIVSDSDSTFVVTFSCFPTVLEIGQSVVGIKCYDEKRALKYTGTSSFFTLGAGERVSVACTFDTTTTTGRLFPEPVGKGGGMDFKVRRVDAGHL